MATNKLQTMSKPVLPRQKSAGKSLMAENQLVDSLTAHISLYHSRSLSQNPNLTANPRSSILKWFSSLSVHQRMASLTVVDRSFVRVALQMLSKLHTLGRGTFIILPDLPSGDLPGLCYRQSRGLLSRVAESNESERWIFDSARLFSSREGEKIEECSCSVGSLDSITVSQEFVENVDRFVETMDSVSNGAFLRGEDSELGSDWVELAWLKAKGYYSMEAFVANRLEVALRLAWLNCNGGRKRGVKLKEKLNASGVASNVYWRKKGCVDWWVKLEGSMRKKVLTAILGKSAKSMTHEILKALHSTSMDDLWLFADEVKETPKSLNCSGSWRRNILTLPPDAEFGLPAKSDSFFRRSTALANVFGALSVLQHILNILLSCQDKNTDKEDILFSTFGSLSTITDGILRKLREFLMIISVDYTTLELFEEGIHQSLSDKPKDKVGTRKKKGKLRNMKRQNLVPKTDVEETQSKKFVKDPENPSVCAEKTGSAEAEILLPNQHSNDMFGEKTSDEHNQGLTVRKGQASGRRSRRNKNRTPQFGGPPKDGKVENSVKEATSSHMVKDDAAAIPENSAQDSDLISSNGRSIDIQSSLNESKAEMESDFLNTPVGAPETKNDTAMNTKQDARNICDVPSIHFQYISNEWPSVAPVYFPHINSQIPAAADRLHLDIGHNWHNHIRQPFVPTMHQVRNPPIDSGCSHILSHPMPMSLDWPPMVRNFSGLASSITCNYDSGFISRRQSAFQRSYAPPNFAFNTKNIEDERRYSGDLIDFAELPNVLEPTDECDSHWISEEELEAHALTAKDYNQFFGGGIMYWNTSDHQATAFSRPTSLSSDDSSWAWPEADMSRAVDDMVAFSSSYSTNGLTSPTAASFCSPFDLGSGHQTVGYVMPGNEVPGKILHSSSATADVVTEEEVSGTTNLSSDTEGKTSDPHPYPILRPIIIPNVSRSRSEFKRPYDRKSPCVPPTRGEQPRLKRPPSPVVLCVPRAPRPPPPSPVSDSRKQRGFPTVRSGSSSPRNWGVRGWYYNGSNSNEVSVRMDGTDVVWPSWRQKNLSTHPMIQPLPGALLQDQLIAVSQLSLDQEHPDTFFSLQPPDPQNCPAQKASISIMHNLLNDEIDYFCKQVAAANIARKPYISWAVKRVTRSLQVLWPRSRTNIFGSNATGLSLPTSDVDLVVCLPPVRNLEPIKEAGILEGRNGIKETCLQHAARYLANQEWVKNDSLKAVENTAIPIIMLVVEVPDDLITSASSSMQSPKDEQAHANREHENVCSDMISQEDTTLPKCLEVMDTQKDAKLIRIDISFKSSSHTGLQTTELVKELTEQFPAATPLALVLKQFLADRSLDQSYSGGLSSYCLVLLITRFLQHEHHVGRPTNQNFGGLLMDFLYFFGNVFDPRQMRVSVQGSGVYINRERGYSIDPIHIDDPLFPTNNVGRNCFRIHQCIKAFSDAYSVLENELTSLASDDDSCPKAQYRMLQKIIPSINTYV